MKKTYDIYGLPFDDLEKAREFVEEAVDIKMTGHESSYRCGDYYRFESNTEETFILQKNYDLQFDEWTFEEHQNAAIILYVDETTRYEEIEQALISKIDGIFLIGRKKV